MAVQTSHQTSRVSAKGQITLPAEYRHRLGIKPRDRVSLSLEDGVVVVKPMASGIMAGFRSIPALKTKRTLRELTEVAADEHAEEAAREGL